MTTTYSTTMDLSKPVDEAFTKALPKIEVSVDLYLIIHHIFILFY